MPVPIASTLSNVSNKWSIDQTRSRTCPQHHTKTQWVPHISQMGDRQYQTRTLEMATIPRILQEMQDGFILWEIQVSVLRIRQHFSNADSCIGIDFKTSPFYEFIEQLGSPTLCDSRLRILVSIRMLTSLKLCLTFGIQSKYLLA
jgi:hypothetical protein